MALPIDRAKSTCHAYHQLSLPLANHVLKVLENPSPAARDADD